MGWLPVGYVLRFPTTINVSSGVSYELVSPEEAVVISPGTIPVEYSPRFLASITYANGTTRSLWASLGCTVKLESPAQPLHAVRWVGTLDLPNGASVSVGEPMSEAEVVTIKATEAEGLGAAIVAAVAVAASLSLLLRRRP